jgi:hypothetical protein
MVSSNYVRIYGATGWHIRLAEEGQDTNGQIGELLRERRDDQTRPCSTEKRAAAAREFTPNLP